VVESGLLVFILVLAGVGFIILRRPGAGPMAMWAWGCVALFGSGLCTFILAEFRWTLPVGHALATAYPVCLLAGALAYAERDRPRWLLPAALALGISRGLAPISPTGLRSPWSRRRLWRAPPTSSEPLGAAPPRAGSGRWPRRSS